MYLRNCWQHGGSVLTHICLSVFEPRLRSVILNAGVFPVVIQPVVSFVSLFISSQIQ